MWSLQLLTAPTIEPISLDEAKQFARVDTTADDSLITGLIASARMSLEQMSSRQFCTASYKLTLDSFRQNYTGQWFDVFRVPNPPQVLGASAFGNVIYPFMVIYCPRPPLQTVTSVQYLDTTGTLQTLVQNTDYLVDTSGEQGRITPQYGTVWPWARAQINSVYVTYTAGYAYNPNAQGVQTPPVWWELIRQAMRLTVSAWYSNREEGDIPPGALRLLEAADYGRYN